MTGNNPYESPQHPAHPMLRKVTSLFWRAAFVAGTFPVSVFLLLDGLTFGLPAADPITGRRHSCVTALEGVLGLGNQGGCLRPFELLVGIALFPTALVCSRYFVQHGVAHSQ